MNHKHGYWRTIIGVPRIRLQWESTDWGWITLGGFVLAFNTTRAFAGRKMLSERMDDYLQANPVLTELIALALYLHVTNKVKPRYDVIHLGFEAISVQSARFRRQNIQPATPTSRTAINGI